MGLQLRTHPSSSTASGHPSCLFMSPEQAWAGTREDMFPKLKKGANPICSGQHRKEEGSHPECREVLAHPLMRPQQWALLHPGKGETVWAQGARERTQFWALYVVCTVNTQTFLTSKNLVPLAGSILTPTAHQKQTSGRK